MPSSRKVKNPTENSNSNFNHTSSQQFGQNTANTLNGSEILISQDQNLIPRKLHPIEAARLQGYPIDDWYKIPVSDNQAYKQFGNSVSVPVIKTIAKEILKQLL